MAGTKPVIGQDGWDQARCRAGWLGPSQLSGRMAGTKPVVGQDGWYQASCRAGQLGSGHREGAGFLGIVFLFPRSSQDTSLYPVSIPVSLAIPPPGHFLAHTKKINGELK